MLKKVLIASLFIGGGVLFIKYLLPKLNTPKQSFDADFIDINQVYEESKLERENRLKEEEESFKKANTVPSWYFEDEDWYDGYLR